MLRKKLKQYKKDSLLYLFLSLLVIISTMIFVSLQVTANSLKLHYERFSISQNKNDFIIIPDYNDLDDLIQSISPYEFENYQKHFENTPYQLDYDNIKNMQNNQYLTTDEINFVQNYISIDLINRIKTSSKPSLVIYHEIRPIILSQIDPQLTDYYRNKIADTQATYFTKLILLLTLNDENYLKFIEYTLDKRLLEKDENNRYQKGTVAELYDLTIEKKVVKKVTTTLKAKEVNYFLTTKQNSLNQPYVVDSIHEMNKLKLNDHEVAIFKEFAEKNDLQLGDQISIENQSYVISAFIYMPDTIYPLLSNNQYYYKMHKDTIVMMNADNFTQYETPDFYSITYTASFNQKGKEDNLLLALKDDFIENDILLSTRFGYSDTILYNNITNLNLLAYILSFSVLIISIIFMSIQLIRKINSDQLQIGILKAHGYYKREIMLPYILQYFMLLFFSTLIGFGLGLVGSKILLNYMFSLFLMPHHYLIISFMTIIGIITPLFITTIANIIILNIKLKKKSVALLNESDMIYQKKTKYPLQSIVKLSLIILLILFGITVYLITHQPMLLYILFGFIILYSVFEKITYSKSFTYQFSIKMSNRNIKKIASFNITFLLTALLILFVFYSKSIYHDMYQSIKENYDYSVFTKYPNFLNLTTEDLSECKKNECEGISSYNFEIYQANEEEVATIYRFEGYQKDATSMIKFIDTSLLSDNEVIISKPLAEKLNLKKGDTLSIITNIENKQSTVVCSTNRKKNCEIATVKIADVANNLTYNRVYSNLKMINYWYYGDHEHRTHINTIYTKTEQSFSKDSPLAKNILVSYHLSDILGQLNYAFYTIILITNFAFIFITTISIIMILIIMELTIKENETQIALLKAFGYQNKEIRKILLSQYQYYFLLIFFLTIPISYLASERLYHFIGVTMGLFLPVNIHLLNILFSFLILWGVYLLSSYLSLIRIRFIALASWLK